VVIMCHSPFAILIASPQLCNLLPLPGLTMRHRVGVSASHSIIHPSPHPSSSFSFYPSFSCSSICLKHRCIVLTHRNASCAKLCFAPCSSLSSTPRIIHHGRRPVSCKPDAISLTSPSCPADVSARRG
jgi:hypothetical protein